MHQTQTGSSKAESYTWGCEVECFFPQRKVQELGISIGSYHHGHPLPSPFAQGWTAERDGTPHTGRRVYVPVEIVSPVLRGRGAEIGVACRAGRGVIQQGKHGALWKRR